MRPFCVILASAMFVLVAGRADATTRKKKKSHRNPAAVQVHEEAAAVHSAVPDANATVRSQEGNAPTEIVPPRRQDATDPFSTPGGEAAPVEKKESERFLTLAADLGNYSLVALGLLGSIDFNRALSADLGLGYSLARGVRLGVRGRYHFLWHETFTPFVGVGAFLNPQDAANLWKSGLFLAPVAGAVMRNDDGAFALLGIGYTFRIAGSRDYDDHGFCWEAAAGYTF